MRSRSFATTPPALRFFFGRIFPLIFVVVGAAVTYVGIRQYYLARESVNWPVAAGAVVASDVESRRSSSSSSGGSSVTYHAEILYEYVVEGITYNGNRVSYGDYGSSNPSHARSVVNKYPEGKRVTVYYKPDRPDVCLLEPGVKAQTMFIPGLGFLFFSVGCVITWMIPRVIRQHDRKVARMLEARSRSQGI